MRRPSINTALLAVVSEGLFSRLSLGLVAFALVATKMVESRESRRDPLDLAGAATLAAGWLGMEQSIEPTEQAVGNAYQHARTLPRTLDGQIGALRHVADVRQVPDLVARLEAFAVDALVLEAAEPAFRRGVVPAIALAAH